jgi:hypothetical protein
MDSALPARQHKKKQPGLDSGPDIGRFQAQDTAMLKFDVA